MYNLLKYLFIFSLTLVWAGCDNSKISNPETEHNEIVLECGLEAIDKTESFDFYRFYLEGRPLPMSEVRFNAVGKEHDTSLHEAIITKNCLGVRKQDLKKYYVRSNKNLQYGFMLKDEIKPEVEGIKHIDLKKVSSSPSAITRCGQHKEAENDTEYFAIPIEIDHKAYNVKAHNTYKVNLSSMSKDIELTVNEYGCVFVDKKRHKDYLEIISKDEEKIIYRRQVNPWLDDRISLEPSKSKIDMCSEDNRYRYNGKCYSYFMYLCLQKSELKKGYQVFFESDTVSQSGGCEEQEEKYKDLTELKFKRSPLKPLLEPLFFIDHYDFLDANNLGIEDITFLKNWKRLTGIDLSKNNIKFLYSLQKLSSLFEINLSKNRIVDLSGIEDLTELETLDLSSNHIESILPLSNLVNVTDLYLNDNDVRDISSLEKMENLVDLNICLNSNISSIKGLSKLSKLQSLYLCSMPNLPYKELYLLPSSILELQLKRMNLKSLRFLTKLPMLNILWIKYSKIDSIGFSSQDQNFGLNLENLKLLNCGLSAIDGIEYFKSLKELDITFNRVESIKSLEKLVNLTDLNLSTNQILDLSYIKNLENLNSLKVVGNPFIKRVSKNNCPLDAKSKVVRDICNDLLKNKSYGF